MNNNNHFGFDDVDLQRLQDYHDSDFDVQSDNRSNRVYHDDGTMFIVYNGLHYIITLGLGQDVSSSDYNRQCNRILRDIGITGRVTGRN